MQGKSNRGRGTRSVQTRDSFWGEMQDLGEGKGEEFGVEETWESVSRAIKRTEQA